MGIRPGNVGIGRDGTGAGMMAGVDGAPETLGSAAGLSCAPKEGHFLQSRFWLVVWNINFIFPYIGNNNPN